MVETTSPAELMARLPQRLVDASPAERARALAKGARAVGRLRPGARLRAHTRDASESASASDDDEPGALRRLVVRLAVDDSWDTLGALIGVVAGEDGPGALLRALNNLRRLTTPAAIGLADRLLDALDGAVPVEQLAKAVAKLAVGLDLEVPEAQTLWDRAIEVSRRRFDDPTEVRAWLIQELVGAHLRGDADSDVLLRTFAPLRPAAVASATEVRLRKVAKDESVHWSRRLAALWLLAESAPGYAGVIESDLERAFTDFPLEALSAVEQTQLALEIERLDHE